MPPNVEHDHNLGAERSAAPTSVSRQSQAPSDCTDVSAPLESTHVRYNPRGVGAKVLSSGNEIGAGWGFANGQAPGAGEWA